MSNTNEIDESNFQSYVLDSDQTVAVDFYAKWCGPCRVMGPILDKLAGKLEGKIKFAKVDVDQAPELAGRFRITGVPTILVFKNGKVADSVVGLLPPHLLKERLEVRRTEQGSEMNRSGYGSVPGTTIL